MAAVDIQRALAVLAVLAWACSPAVPILKRNEDGPPIVLDEDHPSRSFVVRACTTPLREQPSLRTIVHARAQAAGSFSHDAWLRLVTEPVEDLDEPPTFDDVRIDEQHDGELRIIEEWRDDYESPCETGLILVTFELADPSVGAVEIEWSVRVSVTAWEIEDDDALVVHIDG